MQLPDSALVGDSPAYKASWSLWLAAASTSTAAAAAPGFSQSALAFAVSLSCCLGVLLGLVLFGCVLMGPCGHVLPKHDHFVYLAQNCESSLMFSQLAHLKEKKCSTPSCFFTFGAKYSRNPEMNKKYTK
jgi:hypothetical protein